MKPLTGKIAVIATAAVMFFSMTGCGIFEPDDEMNTDIFKIKDDKAGKSIAGDAGMFGGKADLNAANGPGTGAGAYGGNEVLGVDPNNPYADFGTVIPGLQFRPVYFHFDQSRIEAGETGKLDEVASYLKSNAGTGVVIEGHCDSRGSDEYNRGLGERRALAAKEYLLGKGIPENRIRTISYGEEKLAMPGEDEAACSKNRRDEFVGIKMK